MASGAFNIFEIYSEYCDIISNENHACSRDMLKIFSKSLESIEHARDDVFDDLSILMSTLNLSVDSYQFNCFYGFVYFICRENGQKNISINKAIGAWKLVLRGRFRLLNQWCNFLEEHHKHNITEDTWHQLLAFSRCVNENLEGYDPKGAWPVVIDDFVDHMYRVNKQSKCYSSEDMGSPGITNIFSGLNLQPGSKRKCIVDTDMHCEATPTTTFDNNSMRSEHLMKIKRARHSLSPRNINCSEAFATNDAAFAQDDAGWQNSIGCLHISSPSACAVEDCLSKGSDNLSPHQRFQFDQETRVSYT